MLIVVIIEAVLILVLLFNLRPKYDGSMVLTETDTKKTYSIEADTDPYAWGTKKKVVLKVKHFLAEVTRE